MRQRTRETQPTACCCVDGAYSSIIMIGAHTACVCNRVNENTKSVCIISAPFDIHLPIRWCMQKMQMSCSRRLVSCYHFAESLITGAAMRRRRAGPKWVRAASDAAALGMGRCSVCALSTRVAWNAPFNGHFSPIAIHNQFRPALSSRNFCRHVFFQIFCLGCWIWSVLYAAPCASWGCIRWKRLIYLNWSKWIYFAFLTAIQN